MGWCPTPSNTTEDDRHLSGRNGQACFWFSCVIHHYPSSDARRCKSLFGRLRRNGCTIGCAQCDGFTRGPIPDMTQHPCVDQGNSGPGPSTVKPGTPCAKQPALDPTGKPGCAKEFKATNCDPLTRSVNRGAPCGGPEDYYYYSPWRAPGEAPVFDAWSVLWLHTVAPRRASAHARLWFRFADCMHRCTRTAALPVATMRATQRVPIRLQSTPSSETTGVS
eukprot:COSAG02_NODE_13261_length_1419_cov_1.103030_1_plen_221_part_00